MLWRKAKGKSARVVLAELDEAMTSLDTARAELLKAERTQVSVDALRTSYYAVSRAFRKAVVASVSARRVRGPAMDQQIRELVTLEQDHLLNAPSGVLLMMTARPISRAALGPDISGMEYDPTPPGDHAEHLFGGIRPRGERTASAA